MEFLPVFLYRKMFFMDKSSSFALWLLNIYNRLGALKEICLL